MATIPITKRGAEQLKAELHRLKTRDRPEVINAIAGECNLTPLLEGVSATGSVRMQLNEDAATVLSRIAKEVFGATVDLEEEDSGEQVTYQIVGEDEADLKQGLINVSSPIGRALIGKEEGDTAEVQAPGGVKHYEIIAVKYL